MKDVFLLLILFTVALYTAGCIDKTLENNSTYSQNISEKSVVVEATQLNQINASLEKGPVLVKLGAQWCDSCQEMEPVLDQLAAEYGNKVTIMTVDIDKSPELANYFVYSVIPDISVISGIKNGEYVYMQKDGSVYSDRFKARILGAVDKTVLEKTLNFALNSEEK
jgi:thioredoxin 1